jgi:hypothetical protein
MVGNNNNIQEFFGISKIVFFLIKQYAIKNALKIEKFKSHA